MAVLSGSAGAKGTRHRWMARLLAAVACAALAAFAAARPAHPFNEYEVKAAALYNLILFAEWPASAFAATDAPLVVAVVGRGPVADILDELVQTAAWRGHRVVVQRFESILEVGRCHVLYLAVSEHGGWPRLRPRFANLPILTVSSAANFAHDGGAVELKMEHGRMRLIVNRAALRDAGLSLSSQVLRLAELVGE